jgi:hypothetical protein
MSKDMETKNKPILREKPFDFGRLIGVLTGGRGAAAISGTSGRMDGGGIWGSVAARDPADFRVAERIGVWCGEWSSDFSRFVREGRGGEAKGV